MGWSGGGGFGRHGRQRAGPSKASGLQELLVPGDTQWEHSWLMGGPQAWGGLDRQQVGHTGPSTRGLWLLTHLSSSSLTGPVDIGELQPAAGWVSQERDKRTKAFPSTLGMPSLGRDPQDTWAQVPALLPTHEPTLGHSLPLSGP